MDNMKIRNEKIKNSLSSFENQNNLFLQSIKIHTEELDKIANQNMPYELKSKWWHIKKMEIYNDMQKFLTKQTSILLELLKC